MCACVGVRVYALLLNEQNFVSYIMQPMLVNLSAAIGLVED